jgi:MFS transporter, SP family, arabinose:H+ symporter
MNRYILRGTVVGALGVPLFGFGTVVISGTLACMTQTYSLTTDEAGTLVSIALWGKVIGALIAGPQSQQYGSREMLRVTALLYLLSAFGCSLAARGLTTTGNFDEAREVLELMGSPNSRAELDEIRELLLFS